MIVSCLRNLASNFMRKEQNIYRWFASENNTKKKGKKKESMNTHGVMFELRKKKNWEEYFRGVSVPYSYYNLQKLNMNVHPYYVEREWWKKGKRVTFWPGWWALRDVRRREHVMQYGAERLRWKALKENTILPQVTRDEAAGVLHSFPKLSCPKLLVNQCIVTAGRRGKLKRWRLKRQEFRKQADAGKLSGVTRGIW